MLTTAIGRLRVIGFVEGISYLVLMGIAMPLKYLADMPMAVKVTGWAHGVLFVAFSFALLHVFLVHKWSFVKGALAFIAALVPFGTFVLDRHLREEQADASPRPDGEST
jgi:integral membrane protein